MESGDASLRVCWEQQSFLGKLSSGQHLAREVARCSITKPMVGCLGGFELRLCYGTSAVTLGKSQNFSGLPVFDIYKS